jgi:hypothetical protein
MAKKKSDKRLFRNNWLLYSQSRKEYIQRGQVVDLSDMDQAILDEWVKQGVLTPVDPDEDQPEPADGADASAEDSKED